MITDSVRIFDTTLRDGEHAQVLETGNWPKKN